MIINETSVTMTLEEYCEHVTELQECLTDTEEGSEEAEWLNELLETLECNAGKLTMTEDVIVEYMKDYYGGDE